MTSKDVHSELRIEGKEPIGIAIEADKLDNGHTSITPTQWLSPTEEVLSILTQLAEDRLPKEAKRLTTLSSSIAPGELLGGMIPPIELFPEPFKTFSTETPQRLLSLAKKTYQFIRWRYNIQGTHSPFSVRFPEFSLNGSDWYHLPSQMAAEVRTQPQLRMEAYDLNDVETFVKSNDDAPLPHELILEAQQLCDDRNYRSSLVMIVTALELSVKRHVSLALPDATWLIAEAPAPPVLRMLTELVPKLPLAEKGKKLPPLPGNVVQAIKALVNKRNSLVHSPSRIDVTPTYLREVIAVVKDIDWLLAYCQGNEWALGFVRKSTADKLKWK